MSIWIQELLVESITKINDTINYSINLLLRRAVYRSIHYSPHCQRLRAAKYIATLRRGSTHR